MASALDRFWRLFRLGEDRPPLAEYAHSPSRNHSGVAIRVDHRERAGGFVEALERAFGEALVSVETLPVADVIVAGRLAIERKRTDDFAASLKDGRLFQQVARMADEFPERILLVEGDFDREAVGALGGSALRGALLSLALDWRTVPIRTRDVNDSAAFVVQAHARVLARSQRLARTPRSAVPKLEPLAPAASLLATIPGVGAQRADTIAARFPTAALLMRASETELASLDGVGPETARAVKRIFREEDSPAP